ncbi:PREDICTED: carboxypeptidase Q-like [Nicrophorus vespilloides]|uniref:Carboxypeptidase Q n=1 Tax=Nicrophorus vespilloides TaxID=110193 RepID=A0ABM1N5Y0_NICVS|nr:PREDICTED: carboxypeptidase Q-like [Nicrophorus vespilloides]
MQQQAFPRYVLLLSLFVAFANCDLRNNEIDRCHLDDSVRRAIRSHKDVVDRIVSATIDGPFKGSTYNNLSLLVDKFGSRYTGSQNLNDAIDYMIDLGRKQNLESYGEEFLAPYWIRGNESASLIKPVRLDLPMLGLGSSVSTPTEGIVAEAIVVSSFEELDAIGPLAKGKIVVFNQDFVSYPATAKYRSSSADHASAHGAVATLIRSITPFSMRTPHTGSQFYSGKYKKIPTASITVEDAKMLDRRYKRGEKLIIHVKMESKSLTTTTRNTLMNLKGHTYPEKLVMISGHLDCWDVTVGAMDDGAAAVMSWNALAILNALNLRPKRTLRAVLWSGEEQGLIGARAYANSHREDDLTFVMESDEGTFEPIGLEYKGPDTGACILQEILSLFEELNATKLVRSNDVGSDIAVLTSRGIPGASLYNKNERYFWYHHTNADTLDIEDPDVLDKNTALWASVGYIIANLNVDMPKK